MLSVVENKPLGLDNEVIQLTLVDGKLARKPKVRYNKDGSIDKRRPNKVAGKASEVFAFNTEEEIRAMIDVFDKRIKNATNNNRRQIACRNKMLFLIGINIGIRASDLCTLKWSFFFNEKTRMKKDIYENVNGLNIKVATVSVKERTWKDFYTLQPMKQRKQKKFVKLYFNKAIKKAVTDYIEEYPINDINDYLFKSRKGGNPLSPAGLCEIVKDAAADANIEKNIGSHSLRKTFGFWTWHNAEDKNKGLVTLQMLFNHSDTQTTMRYIGLLDREIADMFYSIDLGLDYL